MLHGKQVQLISGVAVAAALALSGSGAAHAAISPDPNANAVAQGTLVDANGVGIPNVEVDLEAWPIDDSLSEGADVPTTIVGTTTTDATGAFWLNYADPASMSFYADDNGVVNLAVSAPIGTSEALYTISRVLPSAYGVHPGAVGIGSDASNSSSVPLTLPVSSDVASASGASPAGGAPGHSRCRTVFDKDLGVKSTEVGEGYTLSGATGSFTYQSGSETNVGVGVSVGGAAGSFSADGSVAAKASSTITMPQISGATGVKWTTGWDMGRYYRTCGRGITEYLVKPHKFAGGAGTETSVAPSSAPYCGSSYLAGSSVAVDRTNAYTFGAGIKLGTGVEFNASTRTGFSSTNTLTYKFSKTLHACGTNGYLADGPRRFVVRP